MDTLFDWVRGSGTFASHGAGWFLPLGKGCLWIKKSLGVDLESGAHCFLAWKARYPNKWKHHSKTYQIRAGNPFYCLSTTDAALRSLFITAAAISPSSSIPST
jgi:hypothetical protein